MSSLASVRRRTRCSRRFPAAFGRVADFGRQRMGRGQRSGSVPVGRVLLQLLLGLRQFGDGLLDFLAAKSFPQLVTALPWPLRKLPPFDRNRPGNRYPPVRPIPSPLRQQLSFDDVQLPQHPADLGTDQHLFSRNDIAFGFQYEAAGRPRLRPGSLRLLDRVLRISRRLGVPLPPGDVGVPASGAENDQQRCGGQRGTSHRAGEASTWESAANARGPAMPPARRTRLKSGLP